MSSRYNSNKIRRRKVSSSETEKTPVSSGRVRRPSNALEEKNLRKKTSVRPLYEPEPDSIIKRMKSVAGDKVSRKKEKAETERKSFGERKKDVSSGYSIKKGSKSSGKARKKRRDYSSAGVIAKWIVSIILIISIAGGVFSFGYYKYVTWGMPEVTKKMVQENYISTSPVSIKDMPKDLRNAIVSIEDERFYKHSGVDIQALVRSLIHNITTDSRQGGSTLEMQLSKNLLTSSEVSINRKIKDIYNAYGMDKVMSKDEVLEAYLNNIYFGKNAYGVEAGAQLYFGKHVKDLNLAECAMLVGITNNPGIYSNYSAAKGRQKVILRKMLELKYINQNQYNEALATEVYFKSEIDK